MFFTLPCLYCIWNIFLRHWWIEEELEKYLETGPRQKWWICLTFKPRINIFCQKNSSFYMWNYIKLRDSEKRGRGTGLNIYNVNSRMIAGLPIFYIGFVSCHIQCNSSFMVSDPSLNDAHYRYKSDESYGSSLKQKKQNYPCCLGGRDGTDDMSSSLKRCWMALCVSGEAC